ncbi:EF-hand domain-containing protein [Streptantibioticus cattleyicolor]|uniref:Calcium binding protein n=1 Tax=Streptantibioticus cattleyicolor (strain ATCC 35852 / DSM 46488 / JCM 4925 / NBRC 14057 / NRRL 8057) TaxID=1003195 RepID=F8JKB4_STREN|nr:EF-hand domain-containing protein [Streptantibioticus cattleyicolor]AEW98523.1 calcium binding protein [Streptantibioticus cattleyicolor NRRL 8057 = DSM 46488]CCB72418.1 putative Calcineurin subunit B [Streptantibioticus cattleyicolor NRRL 8057 = DSM 46488]
MDTLTAKRHIFTMLDTDGDGVISRREYLARPERAARALGRDGDDPLVRAARVAHERVYASMDADGDGRVTFEEYATWAGGEVFDGVCRQALGALFDLADADADGALARAEFTRLRSVLGNDAGNAAKAFDALDTDGDGRVGRDEYLASIRSYVAEGASPMAEALHDGGGQVAGGPFA